MNKNPAKSRNAQRGLSLIELMIVVTIVAILSAFAYPSYERYVIKAKRSIAQNSLLQVADRQQQFFMDNKRTPYIHCLFQT
jgi:type IV pilus assembly protein PilE